MAFALPLLTNYIGVWDSLNKVDYDGNIFAAVTNGLDDKQIY